MLPEAAKYKKEWQSAQQSRLDSGVATDSFVYLHVNADDGVPHHVGIGFKKGRPWNLKRNDKHRSKVKKHGLRVEIVADNLTWEQACFWEVHWIKALRAAGYELTNLTDGGEGAKGYKNTPEAREKKAIAAQKREDGYSAEYKSARAKSAHASRTHEQRIASGVKSWETKVKKGTAHPINYYMTPEGILARAKKGVNTRIKNGTGHNPSLTMDAHKRKVRGLKSAKTRKISESKLTEVELINLSAQRVVQARKASKMRYAGTTPEQRSQEAFEVWQKPGNEIRRASVGQRSKAAWDSREGQLRRKEQSNRMAGEGHHNAKISQETAQLILDAEGTKASIARKFGVSVYIVQDIKWRKSWKHLKPSEKE